MQKNRKFYFFFYVFFFFNRSKSRKKQVFWVSKFRSKIKVRKSTLSCYSYSRYAYSFPPFPLPLPFPALSIFRQKKSHQKKVFGIYSVVKIFLANFCSNKCFFGWTKKQKSLQGIFYKYLFFDLF